MKRRTFLTRSAFATASMAIYGPLGLARPVTRESPMIQLAESQCPYSKHVLEQLRSLPVRPGKAVGDWVLEQLAQIRRGIVGQDDTAESCDFLDAILIYLTPNGPEPLAFRPLVISDHYEGVTNTKVIHTYARENADDLVETAIRHSTTSGIIVVPLLAVYFDRETDGRNRVWAMWRWNRLLSLLPRPQMS